MNIRTFELSPEQLHFKNLLNKDFLELEMDVINNDNPNNNGSHFEIEGMKKSLSSFKNKPILGFFNRGDFESHKGTWEKDTETQTVFWNTENGERILGIIRDNDEIKIQEKNGKTWISLTCALWIQYNFKAVKRLIKDKNKKVSVEIDTLESFIDDKGIEHITLFNLVGITILGSRNGIPIKEGIEGAHLSVLEVFEQNSLQEQRQALCFAYKDIEDTERNFNKETCEKVSSIKVNKSFEAMSDTPWGDIDKSELVRKVVEADNMEEVAPDIYLELDEGWKDKEVTKFKYPVMEVDSQDEAVYNRDGLGVAKAFATQMKNEEVLKKLEAIYKKLGLDKDEKTYSAEEFENAKEFYLSEYLTENYDNEGEDEEKKDKDDDIPNTENDPDDAVVEKPEEAYARIMSECDNLKMEKEKLEEDCVAYEAKIKEMETKCMETEKAYKELSCKYETLEKEAYGFRCGKMAEQAKEMMEGKEIPKEAYDEIIAKCSNGMFETKEILETEIALVAFRNMKAKTTVKKEQYSAPINIESNINNNKQDNKNKKSIEQVRAYLGK